MIFPFSVYFQITARIPLTLHAAFFHHPDAGNVPRHNVSLHPMQMQHLKGNLNGAFYRLGPVFFGSALNNFGVQELLDCFVKIAPSPRPVQALERVVNPEDSKFTGFIFKITANIDPNHRSCVAFCKICSGKFVRNTPYRHIRLGKELRFSSPTQFMAQRKSTIEEAYPGDIIGLPDTGNFKIGQPEG